jgi:hypothetical protein
MSGVLMKYRENQRFHLLADKGTSKPQKQPVGFKGLRMEVYFCHQSHKIFKKMKILDVIETL